MPSDLDPEQVRARVTEVWATDLVAQISDYIRVPAKSPAYDPDWEQRGLLHQVVHDAAAWLSRRGIAGVGVHTEPGRTPVLVFDSPGRGARADRTVLFYGHLDKQPEFEGWNPGTSAWEPVFDGTRLYGRGGADDGYAVYAAATAVLAVDELGADRPRCVAVIETGEESGSPDLRYWLTRLAPDWGPISTLICLDSGAGDYERLWLVSSLRGHCAGRLRVQVLDEGAHSGDAGGIVPSSFRIARQLLDRIEDPVTGQIRLASMQAAIPAERLAQTTATAEILGDEVFARYSWHRGPQAPPAPVDPDPTESLLNRAWRATMEVTGADGLPASPQASNVLRPETTLKLSFRLPPTCDAAAALSELTQVLESDPPYGADVTFTPDPIVVDGWQASDLPASTREALQAASRACFNGHDLAQIGQGGTIPLMGMLASTFPTATMIACGVQGPGTNAHGPNEALHVPYATALTSCLALLIGAT